MSRATFDRSIFYSDEEDDDVDDSSSSSSSSIVSSSSSFEEDEMIVNDGKDDDDDDDDDDDRKPSARPDAQTPRSAAAGGGFPSWLLRIQDSQSTSSSTKRAIAVAARSGGGGGHHENRRAEKQSKPSSHRRGRGEREGAAARKGGHRERNLRRRRRQRRGDALTGRASACPSAAAAPARQQQQNCRRRLSPPDAGSVKRAMSALREVSAELPEEKRTRHREILFQLFFSAGTTRRLRDIAKRSGCSDRSLARICRERYPVQAAPQTSSTLVQSTATTGSDGTDAKFLLSKVIPFLLSSPLSGKLSMSDSSVLGVSGPSFPSPLEQQQQQQTTTTTTTTTTTPANASAAADIDKRDRTFRSGFAARALPDLEEAYTRRLAAARRPRRDCTAGGGQTRKCRDRDGSKEATTTTTSSGRCLSLHFNECSLTAISRWATAMPTTAVYHDDNDVDVDADEANTAAEEVSPELGADAPVEATGVAPLGERDPRHKDSGSSSSSSSSSRSGSIRRSVLAFGGVTRRCGICRLFGHYELECPDKTVENVVSMARGYPEFTEHLAAELRERVGVRPSSLPSRAAVEDSDGRRDAPAVARAAAAAAADAAADAAAVTTIEECDGFLIEQCAVSTAQRESEPGVADRKRHTASGATGEVRYSLKRKRQQPDCDETTRFYGMTIAAARWPSLLSPSVEVGGGGRRQRQRQLLRQQEQKQQRHEHRKRTVVVVNAEAGPSAGITKGDLVTWLDEDDERCHRPRQLEGAIVVHAGIVVEANDGEYGQQKRNTASGGDDDQERRKIPVRYVRSLGPDWISSSSAAGRAGSSVSSLTWMPAARLHVVVPVEADSSIEQMRAE